MSPAEISWPALAYAGGLVLLTCAISVWQRLDLSPGILTGAVRATLQLMVVAQVLLWIFEHPDARLVIAVLVVMILVAAATALSRVKLGRSQRIRLLGLCVLSIGLASAFTLAYVDAVVVPITPWFNPRYLIPMFGMVVANAMNGAALCAERLRSEMVLRAADIEARLALGASAAEAAREPLRLALTAAMIPAINALSVVGIVSLPGMMTGQIIAGTDPTLAVRYQLVVVFMLAAATAITAAVLGLGFRRSFFSAAEQLRLPEER